MVVPLRYLSSQGFSGSGVGGVPAAQGLVGGVGVDGAGLAHRAGVLGVVVDDDAGADVAVVIDPLDVVDHQADAAEAGGRAELVELVVLDIVLVLAVIGHAVEQVSVPDAGGILAVAGACEQPPVVADRRGKKAERGVLAAAAHHRHIGHGVAPFFVEGVDRDGGRRAVDRDQIREAFLFIHLDALLDKELIAGQAVHQRFAALVPGGGVGHDGGVLGRVGGGRRRCVGDALLLLGHGRGGLRRRLGGRFLRRGGAGLHGFGRGGAAAPGNDQEAAERDGGQHGETEDAGQQRLAAGGGFPGGAAGRSAPRLLRRLGRFRLRVLRRGPAAGRVGALVRHGGFSFRQIRGVSDTPRIHQNFRGFLDAPPTRSGRLPGAYRAPYSSRTKRSSAAKLRRTFSVSMQ